MSDLHPANRLPNLRRRVRRARMFPSNTCPSSRFVHMIADELSRKGRSVPIEEIWDGEHMAGSLYSVLESLWKCRKRLLELGEKLP